MKQWSTRKNGLTKRILAGLMCMSLAFSAQGNLRCVYATEGTNTATTEATNVDANGKMGKNSDVGVEVTKSITGTIGKKVDVSFKLKSNDTTKVKLKSVYPVIDTEFPFETSGDAYKVVSAADEAMQQSMDVQFSMNARSDLEDGYQSVRFIGEYSKMSNDGSWVDYYVIKTINIYFSTASTTSSSTNSSTSSKKNTSSSTSKTSSSTSKTSSTTDDDDDDDDSGYTPSYSGGSGSSDIDEEPTAPKLLVSGYETKPEKIMAGETFTLTIHVQNTSKTTSVCNGKFLVGNEAGNFLPTSGSNAIYVESIPAGKTGDLVIEMKTAPDLPQKNYTLVVKGDFDDGKGNNFTSSDNLSVSVYQDVKLGISDVSLSPEMIGIDTEGSLMFTINNQGNAGVYNVMVSVEDEAVTCEDSYIGNIAAGSSAYATLNVVGAKDNSETGTIKVVLTYEDAEGAAGKMEQQVSCMVSEDYEMEFDEFGEDEFEEEDAVMPLWLIILLAVLGVAIIVAIIIIIIKRKKKKAAELLEDDEDGEAENALADEFEDEYGEDDIEDEDF